MSQTDKGHWRDPPKDRVDPDYPPCLTTRFEHVDYCDIVDEYEDDEEDRTIVYDNSNPDERWINAVAYNREDML